MEAHGILLCFFNHLFYLFHALNIAIFKHDVNKRITSVFIGLWAIQ
jgi:hypothetical protein